MAAHADHRGLRGAASVVGPDQVLDLLTAWLTAPVVGPTAFAVVLLVDSEAERSERDTIAAALLRARRRAEEVAGRLQIPGEPAVVRRHLRYLHGEPYDTH